MKIRRAIAAAVIASFMGLPVAACLSPDRILTEEERACCQKMAGNCDEMGMADTSHSCCKPKLQPIRPGIVPSVFRAPAQTVAAPLEPMLFHESQDAGRLVALVAPGPSPPLSPNESVLRI